MKKTITLFIAIAVIVAGGYFVSNSLRNDSSNTSPVSAIKELHKKHLENSPFKEQMGYSKKERIAHGLPPNKYFEQMWELTMDPATGKPNPSKVLELQAELNKQKSKSNINIASRTPGDAMDNMWVERGPNNVGGRTRALLFDPNDPTDETVFAGGVSGGLWKNTNISNENSTWVRVGIDENLTVSSIAVDPNDSNTFYVGTGESYVGGDVNGNGLWKSSDAGATWTNVFGGISGTSYFVSASNITVNSPSSVATDYQSFPTTAFGTEITEVITADLILANDSSGEPTEGCSSFGGDATGKIALIRRGECNFDDKVKNAENAGALGVIMMNNVSGEPVPMGGDDTTIEIPSVMISKEDGDIIEAAILNGDTVNASLNPSEGDFTALVVPGVQHINDIKIKNNGGTSEIYVAASDGFYGDSNATTTMGGLSYGLYKSVDGGANWSLLDVPETEEGHEHCPNDIEISADGTIWMSTKNSSLYGDGGGKIFSSTDNGVTFTEKHAITNGARTQIAVSPTDAGKIYILAELSSGGSVILKKTTDAFVNTFQTTELALPNDADTSIDADDFTRGQAFYDLMLEVDPADDTVVYTGGIDLFKSTDSGASWNQISHWYGGFGEQYVHADQHGLAFGNTETTKQVYGNDGGVYYSSNSGTVISERNKGYNTSQFYTVGVGPTAPYTGDYFAGGLQDNGTQLFEEATTDIINDSEEAYGGDGAYTFFDQDGTDRYFIRNYVYNSGINLYNFDGINVTINNESSSNGAFINPQALDSENDILYSNYSSTDGGSIVRKYSGIKSSLTLSHTDLTDDLLTASPTALTVSPYSGDDSVLLVGTALGDVLLVEPSTSIFVQTAEWTALDGNQLVGSISDVEFGQSIDEIFVTMHNYSVVSIWYTNDGGATWQNKEGDLPDLPVKTILQNPLNLEQVMIGTELGVWYTGNFSDASPNWKQANNGMSNVKVLDLDLRDDNVVFAATYGRGIFSGQLTAEEVTASVDDYNYLDGISIYPTVTEGELTVKSTLQYSDLNLNIYNVSGQIVYTDKLDLTAKSKLLNLNLSSGIYFVRFNTSDSATKTQKIIIK
ncbi:PA domain-containing protein [Lutibacter sp. TH_r2]|uniref:PA domain-containing protein n=1 Tax=Lutibacter sp. TH_r2 TaxID=3082083 RepID=UPI0029555B5C|nr:PA domain-containing protein [Lutibacter sp. TH_r2]MDV7185767.1 PA domain-containing protein [Lutibacter sp. TH_r2]